MFFTMNCRMFLWSLFFFATASNNVNADMPDDLFLVCGHYLVVVYPTLLEKTGYALGNMNEASCDYEPFFKGEKAYSLDPLRDKCELSRNRISFGTAHLDRVTGIFKTRKITLRADMEKIYNSAPKLGSGGPITYVELDHIGRSTSGGFNKPSVNRPDQSGDSYGCDFRSRSDLNLIIERHNNALEAKLPKRKF